MKSSRKVRKRARKVRNASGKSRKVSEKSEKDYGKVSGKVGKAYGRSGKAIKDKNVESQESKLKHEIFCHHANPSNIHSSRVRLAQMGQLCILFSTFSESTLQASQFTNTHIFLLPVQIYRVWLAPSLTL